MESHSIAFLIPFRRNKTIKCLFRLSLQCKFRLLLIPSRHLASVEQVYADKSNSPVFFVFDSRDGRVKLSDILVS